MKGRALPIIRAVMPHGLPANYVPHLKLKVKYSTFALGVEARSDKGQGFLHGGLDNLLY